MQNNELFKLFEEAYKRQERNLLVFSQCASYLNHTPCAMNSEYMQEITGGDKGLEEYSYALFLANVFCESAGEADELLEEYYIKSVKRLNPDKYKQDPYYKSIKIPNKQIGKWNLGKQSYKPYEAFIYRDIIREGYTEIPQIGFFNEEFSFPTVYENGIEWMAIKPNEIETMKEPIANAKGSVLVYGLGLGYFAYMVSLKKEVTDITVVEREESVIKLFEDCILPQFENKHKIKIVKSDAFDYAKNQMGNGKYDYVFADLWHDVSDGVDLYVKMKKHEALLPKAKFDYWIERSILSSIRVNLMDGIYKKYKEKKLNDTALIQNILNDNFVEKIIRIL